jgi:hypothetical protein
VAEAARLAPFCFFIAYLDRVNIGFANAAMSKDLTLTAAFANVAAELASTPDAKARNRRAAF